jgi:hypothetical protein
MGETRKLAARRIEFRVGIHLGDVVEEADGDLMGDGVNIAARLDGAAICLSEDTYRQVKSRLELRVHDLGDVSLKNIVESVRAYALEVGPAAQLTPVKEPEFSPRRAGGLPTACEGKLAVWEAGKASHRRPAMGAVRARPSSLRRTGKNPACSSA